MNEKKGGLRHMMHLFGLNSFQYYIGLLLSDWIIHLIPVTVATLLVLPFEDIMLRENVGDFVICYIFFGCVMNCLSYFFAHLFTDPESGIKYMSLIYIIGLFIAPMVISGFASSEDREFEDMFALWYWVTPLCTFMVVCQNICNRGQVEYKSFDFNGEPIGMPITILVFLYQILIIFTITVLIDRCIRNAYKDKEGTDGESPPLLDVHDDVKEHEAHVRQSDTSDASDPDHYQIRAVDLCKTYESSKTMAVCRNTFGVKLGEVYGLLGPNGAGKSTTFGMMAMQFPLTSG